MIFKTYYGWEENGKFFLSVFSPTQFLGRSIPRNEYATKAEAEAEATRRGAEIEWR